MGAQSGSYLDYINEDTDLSILNEFSKGIEFYPRQLQAIKESVLSNSGIWTVEMGLGKTILTVGIANLFQPLLSGDKVMLVCADSNTIESFREYIQNNTNLKYVYTTGEAEKVQNCIKMVEMGQANCILCTHSAWKTSLDFNIFIYNNIEKFICMVYDECEGTEENQGYQNFIEIAHHVPYVFPANATPLNSGTYVLYSLLYATKAFDISHREFRRKFCINKEVGDHTITLVDSTKIKELYGKKIINFNRKDVNAETVYEDPRFDRVELSRKQEDTLDAKLANRAEVLYGISPASPTPVANPAFIKLLQTVTTIPQNESKVIFCWHKETSEMIARTFRGMGMTVLQINGYITEDPIEKKAVEEEFNNTPGAILITSAYKGNNLNSANHIIVYETPPDIGQYIARIARGYNSKIVHLYWIYYPNLEIDTLFKALESCLKNDDFTDRDPVLALLLIEELEDIVPKDPRLQIYKELLNN